MRGFLLSYLAYVVLMVALLVLSSLWGSVGVPPHWKSGVTNALEVNSALALTSPGSGCRIDQPTFGDLNRLDSPVVVWC